MYIARLAISNGADNWYNCLFTAILYKNKNFISWMIKKGSIIIDRDLLEYVNDTEVLEILLSSANFKNSSMLNLNGFITEYTKPEHIPILLKYGATKKINKENIQYKSICYILDQFNI